MFCIDGDPSSTPSTGKPSAGRRCDSGGIFNAFRNQRRNAFCTGTFSEDELSGCGTRLPGGMTAWITCPLPKDAAERKNASHELGLWYNGARYSQDCPLRLGVTKGGEKEPQFLLAQQQIVILP